MTGRSFGRSSDDMPGIQALASSRSTVRMTPIRANRAIDTLMLAESRQPSSQRGAVPAARLEINGKGQAGGAISRIGSGRIIVTPLLVRSRSTLKLAKPLFHRRCY